MDLGGMDLRGLAEFVVNANRNTYASNGGKTAPVLQGSRQLEFSQGEYFYRDVYFGSERFQGQSVVYFGSRPVWGMVYSGGVISDRLSAEAEVFVFLKEALRQVTVEEPFRGPRRYARGPSTYSNTSTGTVERFHGVEEILLGDECIYRLHYEGGLISGED